jgi:hypothetical protein
MLFYLSTQPTDVPVSIGGSLMCKIVRNHNTEEGEGHKRIVHVGVGSSNVASSWTLLFFSLRPFLVSRHKVV